MRITIKTALHAVLAICLIPSLFFIFLLWQRTADAQIQLIQSEFLLRATEVRHEVERQIADATHELGLLKSSPHAKRENWKALYQEAARIVANHPNFAAISLVDQTGRLIFLTKIPFGQPTFQTPASENLHRAIISGKTRLSGPFTIPDAQGYRVAVTMPIRSNHSQNYILRVIFRADYFANLIMQKSWPDHWVCTLFDRDGIIISRSEKNDQFIGKAVGIPAENFSRIYDHKVFAFQKASQGLTHVLLNQIHDRDWFVAVEVNESTFHEKYYAELKKFLPASLIFFVGITVFCFGFSARIEKDLKKLGIFLSERKASSQSSTFFIIHEIESLTRGLITLKQNFDNTKKELQTTHLEKQSIADLYEHAPCGYHSLSPEGNILHINKTETDWLGYKKSEMLGKSYANFFTEKSKQKFTVTFPEFLKNGYVNDLEFELVRKDRSVIPVSISATLLRDEYGNSVMSRSTVFDIRERKAFEQQLLELSTKDTLTGLSNRRHFYELANQSISQCDREDTTLALAIVDIDHFKSINDRYGHRVGDIALQAVSEHMKNFLRTGDIVARIGGEEFAIILPKLNIRHAEPVLNRLRESISTLTIHTPKNESFHVSISVGITEKQKLEVDVDAIVSRADVALYYSKSSGRNRVSTG